MKRRECEFAVSFPISGGLIKILKDLSHLDWLDKDFWTMLMQIANSTA